MGHWRQMTCHVRTKRQNDKINEIKFPYVPKHGDADVTADADDSPV